MIEWKRPCGLSSDGRRAGRAHRAGGAQGAEREPGLRPAVDRGRLPGVDHLDDGVEVVDVDRAGDVGAAEAELAGRAQHVRERRGDRAVKVGPPLGLVGATTGAVPEDDAERPLGERLFERGAERGGTCHDLRR